MILWNKFGIPRVKKKGWWLGYDSSHNSWIPEIDIQIIWGNLLNMAQGFDKFKLDDFNNKYPEYDMMETDNLDNLSGYLFDMLQN